ncbi:hypothetical protein, partial [Shewanella xiamenensis]|uniref:hypothetical protein n=1 Tax=Shewanella xiamenensis TaxID=332186 RepID=UPI0035B6DD30
TVNSSQGAANGDDTTGGSDTDGDGKGDTVIDPAAGPQITDLRLAGKLEVGQSLSATYGFNANGGDRNDKSTYAWGNKGDTAATVAAGASVTTSGQVPAVSLTAADIGEIKEVSVQAKNGLAITGNTLTVNSSQGAANGDDTTGGSDTDGDGKGDTVIDPAAGPQITDLRLAGKLEVGQSLSATYGFNANGGDRNDKSTYAWGNKGDTAATVAAGASVTTSGQVPAVSLTAADIGEIKEVSVQAKNGLAITGNTLTVDSSQGAGNGDDTTGGGNGGEVLDPNNIQVAIHYTSSATILANGTNGGVYTGTENIRAVANVDEMTAMCQIAGESSMSPCDTRFNLNWYVNGRIVPGAITQKFTPVTTDQGFPIAVEATLKP